MVETPKLTDEQLQVPNLGEPRHPSPLRRSTAPGQGRGCFTPDDMRVLYEPRYSVGGQPAPVGLERAGPRERIYFEPSQVKAAVVSCGGLCPGINNVVRSLVHELRLNYGVPEVLGIRFGYQGLNPAQARPPIDLTLEAVEPIHHMGGTILGTSRGHQDPAVTTEFLRSEGVNILFCIGGDGTQRGAHAIAAEAARRGLDLAVVGVPKTIDNDIKFCFRTFGFYTAVAEAEKVIDRAHIEAKAVLNGVGLVKLMGREAGFIAAAAAVASGEANFVLIPEVPLVLEGDDGFLARLERRLLAREHAVVVVAEGAGQHLMETDPEAADASGNRRLGDIGPLLKERIREHFAERDTPVSVKYFDPSYHIRSAPASAADSFYCQELARSAVHAAMAGKTDMLIGLWHNHLVHVPLEVSTGAKKRLSPEGELWTAVLAATGQESL